jgi:hypothetical protein
VTGPAEFFFFLQRILQEHGRRVTGMRSGESTRRASHDPVR